MAALAVAGMVPTSLIDPTASLSGFKATVRTLASTSRRHEVMDEARTTAKNIYGIPPAMITRMTGQTVDIDPVEQNVAWVYPQLRWDPLPTLQGYFAYTPGARSGQRSLHRIEARPRYILRQVQSSVDGGLPILGEPATQVAIACNYHRDHQQSRLAVAGTRDEPVRLDAGDRSHAPDVRSGDSGSEGESG